MYSLDFQKEKKRQPLQVRNKKSCKENTEEHLTFLNQVLSYSSLSLNPNQVGGEGVKWPRAKKNYPFSGTDCPIDLKP